MLLNGLNKTGPYPFGPMPQPIAVIVSEVKTFSGSVAIDYINHHISKKLVLDAYPGKVFTGKVLTTIDTSGKGQLQASGDLPTDIGSGGPTSFAVRIRLDKGESLGWAAG